MGARPVGKAGLSLLPEPPNVQGRQASKAPSVTGGTGIL